MSSHPSKNKKKQEMIFHTVAKRTFKVSDKQLATLSHETVPNPHYRSGPPSRLYSREDVQKLAKSLTPTERDTSKRRSNAGKAAAQKRKEQLIETAEQLPIKVLVVSQEQVIRDACAHYNSAERRDRDENYASERSDREFLDRITVNYIRHCLTKYEDFLADIRGRPGVDEAYQIIRERILDEIANKYLWLDYECDRQAMEQDK